MGDHNKEAIQVEAVGDALQSLMDAVNGPAHLRLIDTFAAEDDLLAFEVPWWPCLSEVSAEVIRVWWAGHQRVVRGTLTFTRYDPATSISTLFGATFEPAHQGFVLRWTVADRDGVRQRCSRWPRGLLDTIQVMTFWLRQDYAFTELLDADWTPDLALWNTTETLWDVLGAAPEEGVMPSPDLRSSRHPGRHQFRWFEPLG